MRMCRLRNDGNAVHLTSDHIAGENQKQLQPALQLLSKHGIGAILDYAAEDDVQAEDGPASRSELHESVIARTFDYDNEAKCEQHTSTFLRNIKAASEAPGQGFAAIKVQSTFEALSGERALTQWTGRFSGLDRAKIQQGQDQSVILLRLQ